MQTVNYENFIKFIIGKSAFFIAFRYNGEIKMKRISFSNITKLIDYTMNVDSTDVLFLLLNLQIALRFNRSWRYLVKSGTVIVGEKEIYFESIKKSEYVNLKLNRKLYNVIKNNHISKVHVIKAVSCNNKHVRFVTKLGSFIVPKQLIIKMHNAICSRANKNVSLNKNEILHFINRVIEDKMLIDVSYIIDDINIVMTYDFITDVYDRDMYWLTGY